MRLAQRQYQLTCRALDGSGYLGMVKVAVSALCLVLMIAGVCLEFQPLGPSEPVSMVIFAIAVASSGVYGAISWAFPFPGYRAGLLTAAWADVAIAVAAACLPVASVQFGVASLMVLVGMFVAFLHGRHILVIHCLFGAAVIVAFGIRVTGFGGTSFFDFFAYAFPTAVAVLAVPIITFLVMEGFRHSIRRTAVAAQQDPLTGLHNRRSMYARAAAEIQRNRESVLITAVVDVDRFKSINDRFGHSAGDAVIVAVARHLSTFIDGADIIGRTGGDEFAVIALRDAPGDVAGIVERLHAVQRVAEEDYTVSIGVASGRPVHSMTTLTSLLRRADAAMYQAKTSGAGQLCVAPLV